MLVNFADILKDAEKGNYAVGGFNTPTLETLKAVIDAAQEMNSPVMINHAEGDQGVVDIDVIGPLMIEYAKKATVPVAVHIDHGLTDDFVLRAIRAGFTSIMYDMSAYDFETNVEKTSKFVKIAHSIGVSVEAMINEMPANMPGKGMTIGWNTARTDDIPLSEFFTRPNEAGEFCERTGVDALTVSFGTVHGKYVAKPNLDIERLKAIKEKTPHTSLVMHGGSGVDAAQVRDAINHGVRKINYYTAMTTAPAPEILKTIEGSKDPIYFENIAQMGYEIMKEKCMAAIKIFLNKD
ncbi:MAG: class II fructose-bisphosphate aldolase [Candidatus Pararuminococcus gallinarum]|uniref:class II fructose-bisphosphate aldolase n=1 Tax=Zongyangia sp. HA2173 TaxID=3133035 RepID=UPI00316A823D